MAMDPGGFNGSSIDVDEVTAVCFLPTPMFQTPTFASSGSDSVIRLWQRNTKGMYERLAAITTTAGRNRYGRPVQAPNGALEQPSDAEIQDMLKNLPPDQHKQMEKLFKDVPKVEDSAGALLNKLDATSPSNDALGSETILGFAISPDGHWLVASNFDGVFSVDLKKTLAILTPPADQIERITSAMLGLEQDEQGILRPIERARLVPVK